MKKLKKMIPILILCLAMGVWLAGCAGKGAPEKTNCDTRIKWDVIGEVKLTQFDCAVGKHGGQTSLIFTVGLENPTEQPYRYRVNIFLEDMNKAAGHYVPRKGKPPVVNPGKTETVKIPFIGTDKMPKKVLVMVTTMSRE
ncbi:MAG: hypothetical protein JRF29_04890 [Deltaproteobacteria bacterium]|jgi:hypothetical protein|nr:hypothetical protein [Deltaproteobacteria bacterium]